MKIVADVHLHSHFSRATSKNLNLEHLSKWAQLKGVMVVGTGDIAHPGWLQEMKDKLEPAEEGLFKLKAEIGTTIQAQVFDACEAPVRFMLAGEISNIYKKHDKVRKIHHVVFMPSFDALERFQAKLETIGNIRSDGRPILGLDSRDLLEIVLETDPQGYLIPAHIWTPWFALLGSMSGFDSVQECFDDLTEHIFALETGLSSDPPMNWRLSILDKYTLVSNSDAHSPQKLAREANIFDTELSYPAIFEALRTGSHDHFLGTIEFFPEEGKYHYDGHRKCRLRWHPQQTLAHDGICPQCGKKVTVGVMHRVESLADREFTPHSPGRHPYKSLVPLPEILAEIHNVGVNSKRVQAGFQFLLSKLGSELHILQDAPLEDIERFGGPMVSEGIRRMRAGELQIAAGYDGEYGTIRLFDEHERESFSTQLGFFVENVKRAADTRSEQAPPKVAEPSGHYGKAITEEETSPRTSDSEGAPAARRKEPAAAAQALSATLDSWGLNEEQRRAVAYTDSPLLIVAGPGTGKTRTLTHRIAYLIRQKDVAANAILAVTFTNRAAHEMMARLQALIGVPEARAVTVCTFHAFCARLLSEEGESLAIPANFSICTEREKREILKEVAPELSTKALNLVLDAFALAKNQVRSPAEFPPGPSLPASVRFVEIYEQYQARLLRERMLDFDDLLVYTIQLCEKHPEILAKVRRRFAWILVDEYQDVNRAQYQLLRLLASDHTNLCVIGDPDQAIYGFRGASREFFLRFTQDFPTARVVGLERNYRSTQTILDASSQVLADHKARDGQNLWSDIVTDTRVEFYTAPTDRAEAEVVVHTIERMVGGTSYFSIDSGRVDGEAIKSETTFADIAVLYRLRAQSALLQEAFQRSGMPYQTVGETPFFERAEVSAILDYLWLSLHEQDDFHLKRILASTGGGIGPGAVAHLLEAAALRHHSLWQTLCEASTGRVLNRKQVNAIGRLVENLTELRQRAQSGTVTDLIEHVTETFFAPDHFRKTATASDLHKQLLLKASLFDNNLHLFLRSAVLSHETDEYDARADRVSLMTVHAAKGLEFPVVFIVGCEDTLIPYQPEGKVTDFDEERRLLYVGMTRAREKLILTNAKTRVLFGKKTTPPASRFLKDIGQALVEVKKRPFKEKKKGPQKTPQIELF